MTSFHICFLIGFVPYRTFHISLYKRLTSFGTFHICSLVRFIFFPPISSFHVTFRIIKILISPWFRGLKLYHYFPFVIFFLFFWSSFWRQEFFYFRVTFRVVYYSFDSRTLLLIHLRVTFIAVIICMMLYNIILLNLRLLILKLVTMLIIVIPLSMSTNPRAFLVPPRSNLFNLPFPPTFLISYIILLLVNPWLFLIIITAYILQVNLALLLQVTLILLRQLLVLWVNGVGKERMCWGELCSWVF